jgi:hypothetical protein
MKMSFDKLLRDLIHAGKFSQSVLCVQSRLALKKVTAVGLLLILKLITSMMHNRLYPVSLSICDELLLMHRLHDQDDYL